MNIKYLTSYFSLGFSDEAINGMRIVKDVVQVNGGVHKVPVTRGVI